MKIPAEITESAGRYSENLRKAAEKLLKTHKKHLRAIILGEESFAKNIHDAEGRALGSCVDVRGNVITTAELIFLMDYRFASQRGSKCLLEFLDHLDEVGRKYSIKGKFKLEVYAYPYARYASEKIEKAKERIIYMRR